MTLAKIIYDTFKIPKIMKVYISKPAKFDKTVIFIHGFSASSHFWDNIKHKLANQYQIITVDLLGFGESDKDDWLNYDVEDQAKSLFLALFKSGKILAKDIVLVGHSMGSLVAIEFTKRYPLFVKNLILVSPPIYRYQSTLTQDDLNLNLYQTIANSKSLIKISDRILKTFLQEKPNMTKSTQIALKKSLENAIIKQNSFAVLSKINKPINILYGYFDPIIVAKNLKQLAKNNKNIKLRATFASHHVWGDLEKQLIEVLKAN